MQWDERLRELTQLLQVRPSFPVVVSVALIVAILGGCDLLKKKRNAGSFEDDPVSNAPTVTVGGTGAKNEKDVLRYANETAVADELGVIGKDGTKTKTFPGTGADISTLNKGVVVTKKAKFFSTGILVVYDDPATADGTKLMGWIPPEAIAAPSATPIPTATQAFTTKPAAPKDAGAGVADAAAAAVDAGGAARPTALLQVIPSTGGKCPAGFALFGPFCRRPCNADGDCPANSFCTQTSNASNAKKTCSATK